MRMIKGLMLPALLILFLCGCTRKETVPDIEEAFRGVLEGSAVFYEERGDSVVEMTLTEYCEGFTESLPAAIKQAAMVDLEQDAVPEIILRIALGKNLNCAVLVLHWENEEVWGYTLNERQMQEIKADGTFLWSGSSASYGVATAVFSNGTYSYKNILWGEESEDKGRFYKKGTEITSEEFENIFNQYSSLEEPQWLGYPMESDDSLFE